MSKENFQYTGTDNLEVMVDAINYNNYLHKFVWDNCNHSSTIADFGAGIGTFAEKLHAKSKNVIAIEPDLSQQKIIKSKGIKCITDISELPDEHLDVVYSINVLEHIENDLEALELIGKKIQLNGKIVIYVPAFQILFSSMDRKVGHFRRYSKSDLENKIIAAGFSIVSTQYVDSLGFIASIIYKWIGSKNGDLNIKTIIFYDRIVFPLSRIFDLFLGKLMGKNLAVVATKK